MKGGSVHAWLFLAFLLLALAPLLGAGWFFLQTYEDALRETVASNLVQIANKKYDQIDFFLQERNADITLTSNRPSIQNALTDLGDLWRQQGFQSPSYRQLMDSLDDTSQFFLESGDYYDLLLIDTAGNVLYSIARESDLGTNLFTGPYRNSNLAEGVEIALNLMLPNQTVFAPYEPSQSRTASFLVSPVLHDGVLIGALALQLNWDRLQSVVTDRTGLGTTGETVLAQRDNDSALYTAPLREIENAAFRHRVPISEVATPMQHALAGQSGYGVMAKDYAGHDVVAAWRYLPALHWGMVVKIDSVEAFAPLTRMKQITLSMLALLACVMSLLALYFGKSLAEPLQSLIKATTYMAQRDFRVKAKPTGPLELRELAASFNQMSDHLAKLYEGLEVEVKERDREIAARKAAEVALVNAKEAAEAANRAKSVFLANMSHELRTPLNAILGFAQIMERDESLSENHRRELGTINRSGRHLLSLINDVLEISRIEAGRTTVQKEIFCLTEMLAAVEDMIRVRADAKGLQFISERTGQLPGYVTGDAHHLRQILLNLLGNAVKYTEQGSVTLRIEAMDDDIRFEVADTGVGIAFEEQSRIFQAFYQTATGAAKGEGTGLGLTISREFVRLMGGEISVSSEPGKGSIFSFTLSLPEADAPALGAPTHRVIGLAPGQAPVRVLVAEDNADNRELIGLLLTPIGLDVRLVENGEQAIACFESWHPQFIWMDMRMPVLNGYEATKRIRSLPGGQQVKIAALTASAFREDRGAILAAGCDDMLSKPVDEQRLFQVMGDQLGLRYLFAEDSTEKQELKHSPGMIDLSPLPPKLRAELADAAELLEAESVNAIAECIRADYPNIAKAIKDYTEAYRFDILAKLCRESENPLE